MKIKLLALLASVGGVAGAGLSGASIQLATTNNKYDFGTIKKQILTKNVRFNLSSLNNRGGLLDSSIKQDMYLAFSRNYSNFDIADLQMTFYYGGNTDNKIDFGFGEYRTILYFSVEFHSISNKFKDSFVTFDFRPTLVPWKDDYLGYKGVNLFLDNASKTKIKNFSDFLINSNKYLQNQKIISNFKAQWKRMNINPDGLSNSDRQNNLVFSNELINYVKSNINLPITNKDGTINTKLFDMIPEDLKTNTISNFNSSLNVGWTDYYQLKSSDFGKNGAGLDTQIILSEINKNYLNMKLSDFKGLIKDTVREHIFAATNYKVYLDDTDFDIVCKVSYHFDDPIIDWNTNVKDVTKNKQLWIEVDSNSMNNPFIDCSTGPGFHIKIAK